MKAKSTFLIVSLVFLVCVFARVAPAQDWAFQLSDKAKEIYTKKKVQIPCKRIEDLLHKDDISGLYTAIRDAALFGDKTCGEYIKKNLDTL